MLDTVGILVDRRTFKGIPSRRTGNERLALYNKAAKLLGLKLFYMSLDQVGRKSASGFTYRKKTYKLERLPIPAVTHNRVITFSSEENRKLKQLSQTSFLFNRQNRYDKYKIYKLIYQNPTLRAYLPVSMVFTQAQLQSAMKNYSSLYIKPTNSSVGEGIMKLKKHKSGKWLFYWKKGSPKLLSSKKAVSTITRYVGKMRYMIQEAIPVATYEGRPYDLRVTVQRGSAGSWQLIGMIGRIAATGRHVTNVAKGGKVKKVKELFQASGFEPEQMEAAIREASLQIMSYLSEKLTHLADVGLDIGVDRQGAIQLIEINGRDQRYSFQKAKMSTTFYRTYETPMKYAKYVLNQKNQKPFNA
jgi:hypothetical protein